MTIYMVYYQREEQETDEELFLCVRPDVESARHAAEEDARDQGFQLTTKLPPRPSIGRKGYFRWGIRDGRKNPNISGDGQENPNILTDWTYSDAARYIIAPVELPGIVALLDYNQAQLAREALDSHIYWQLSDAQYRNDGYVQEPGADDEETQADIAAAQALQTKLVEGIEASTVDATPVEPEAHA